MTENDSFEDEGPISDERDGEGGTSDIIVYVDRSRVRDGMLDELEAGMAELVEFVEENEPQILSYNVYFSADDAQMTVIHAHSEPASLAFHMKVAGPEFPSVASYIDLETIDVYGRPGEDVLQKLRTKASTLGDGRVSVHDPHRGFDRITSD